MWEYASKPNYVRPQSNLFKKIIIFQLSNQKQIESWTVLDKLSCKVVYDFTSKQYVGVFAHKWIRRWSSECNDINNIKKIKVSLVFRRLPSNVIIKNVFFFR